MVGGAFRRTFRSEGAGEREGVGEPTQLTGEERTREHGQGEEMPAPHSLLPVGWPNPPQNKLMDFTFRHSIDIDTTPPPGFGNSWRRNNGEIHVRHPSVFEIPRRNLRGGP